MKPVPKQPVVPHELDIGMKHVQEQTGNRPDLATTLRSRRPSICNVGFSYTRYSTTLLNGSSLPSGIVLNSWGSLAWESREEQVVVPHPMHLFTLM